MIVMVPASWAAVKSVHAQLTEEERKRLREQYGGLGTSTTTARQRQQREDQLRRERAARSKATTTAQARSMVGQVFLDPRSGQTGILNYRQDRRTGRPILSLTIDERGRAVEIGPGELVGEGGRVTTIDQFGRATGEGHFLTEREQEAWFGGTGAFGTAAGRDYVGEAAQQHGYDVQLEQMKQAFQAEQARLDAERAMELQRLQEENALKRAKLGEAGSLARTAAEVQQRARQWINQNIGVDPIRAGIGRQGGVQRGETPAQGFTKELRGIAAAPIPTVSEDASLPEIEQVIASLQGQQQAPVMPSLGFAAGGTIDMTSNAEGVFEAQPPEMGMVPMGSTPTEGPPVTPGFGGPNAQVGTTKRAILVGEKGGFTGDEEVVIIDQAQPGKVEVIPLMAGAAAGGTYESLTPEQQASRPYDTDYLFQTLAPIYRKLGLGGVPTKMPTGQGFAFSPGQVGNRMVGGSQILPSLGYNPRLIRDVSSGNTYYRGPEGQLHHLSPEAWNQGKFQIGDVLNVAPNEVSQFGEFGAPQTSAPNIAEQPYQRFGQRSIPLSVPQPGGYDIPLPDERVLAGIWRYLDANTQHVLASFYGVGGLGGGPSGDATQNALMQIQDIVKGLTPVGTGRSASAHF